MAGIVIYANYLQLLNFQQYILCTFDLYLNKAINLPICLFNYYGSTIWLKAVFFDTHHEYFYVQF